MFVELKKIPDTPVDEIELDPIQDLEEEILCHKYLYYVLAKPIISNYEYDHLVKKAHKVLPENSDSFKIGSDRGQDYSKKIKWLAQKMLAKKRNYCNICE